MKKYRRDSVFSECCGILIFLLKNDIYHIKGDLHGMDCVESFQLDDIILDNKINILDVTLILDRSLGNIPSF